MIARAVAVAWLALALVLAQAAGLVHRVVHGPLASVAHVSSFDDHDPHHDHDHGHGLAALFGGHGDEADCRLFDPLHHDAVALAPRVILPLVFAAQVFAFAEGEQRARWAALFDARGPPERIR